MQCCSTVSLLCNLKVFSSSVVYTHEAESLQKVHLLSIDGLITQAVPLNQEEECHRDMAMLKCTAKKTNAPLLVQHKLKYSHQLNTDLDHSITVNRVRPLVETTGTVSVTNLYTRGSSIFSEEQKYRNMPLPFGLLYKYLMTLCKISPGQLLIFYKVSKTVHRICFYFMLGTF